MALDMQNCLNDGCSNPADIFCAILTFLGGKICEICGINLSKNGVKWIRAH